MKHKFEIGDRVASLLGKEFTDVLGEYGVVCGFKKFSCRPLMHIVEFDGYIGQSSPYHPDNLITEEEFIYINDFHERIRERLF